jgi:hypothetical protein
MGFLKGGSFTCFSFVLSSGRRCDAHGPAGLLAQVEVFLDEVDDFLRVDAAVEDDVRCSTCGNVGRLKG